MYIHEPFKGDDQLTRETSERKFSELQGKYLNERKMSLQKML